MTQPPRRWLFWNVDPRRSFTIAEFSVLGSASQRLVELAEQQAPELAEWITTEAEQYLAALRSPEPVESDAFIAELRSELPGEWADRAEAIYRRHLK